VRNKVFWIGMLLSLFGAARAAAWQEAARRICQDDLGVPLAIVRGIVHVESGGHAYVLNVGIGDVWQAYRFDRVQEARVFLKEALNHTERIDIGLMQVHWAWWKDHYPVEPADLLEVETNLRVGCDILRRELAGAGPLWQRIGRYHSRNPARNQHYALKVLYASLQP